MKTGIKIAISGKSGCGNTTVSRLVAGKLGLRLINYTFHAMAEEKGMDFKELYRRAQEDLSFDRYLDKRQVELAREGDCVLGSRLAIWLLEDADLRVYLYAPLEVRARRIQEREGGDIRKIEEDTQDRDEKDHNRYLKLYNIDNNDYHFADLIVDVSNHDQYETADMIVERARSID
jgi:cytidylate kinase